MAHAIRHHDLVGKVPGRRGLLARLVEGYRRRRDLRAAERELSALDERLLGDIGILRGDIRDVVRGTRRPV